MELKEEIENIVKQTVKQSLHPDWYREPLIGYVAADNPGFGELENLIGNQMMLPGEILPEAQTVIVYFLPYSEALGKQIRGDEIIYQEWSDYYEMTNLLLDEISEKLIAFLNKKRYISKKIPPTNNFDENTLTAQWSHKSVAVMAGLGSFGLNHLLVTKYGTAGRLNSFITSAKIEPSEETRHQFCLYFQTGKCRVCLEKCPSGALSEHGIDKFRCNAYLYGKNVHDLQQGCAMCSSGPCMLRGY